MKTGADESLDGIGGWDKLEGCAAGGADAAGAVNMSEKLSGREWSFSCFFWMERAIQKIPPKEKRRSAMPANR